MKKLRNKNFIILIIVIVIIAISLSTYFIIANAKKEISIESFDDKVTMSFGSHKVGNIYYDFHYNYMRFSAKDGTFLEFILNSEYLVQKANGNKDYNIYLFLYDNYYFTVRQEPNNVFFVHSAYITIGKLNESDIDFPILTSPDDQYKSFEDPSDTVYLTWDSILFYDNFQAFVETFKNINQEYVGSINETDQVVRLFAYTRNSDSELEEFIIRKDKNLVITPHENGLKLVWEDVIND
ncbi:MAG: hypothetical protein LBF68_03180 [Christensenellaceae bacterium]|jgi:hypothetical protein|nr:hypothetical protein [Christensenellaceae bacterium]